MTIDLSTSIAGVKIDPLVMNASGPRSGTRKDLLDLAGGAGGAIVTKSITRAPRAGNPEPRYANLWPSDSALNAMGLPNLGVEAYCALLPEIMTVTKKPIIASVAGEDAAEYVEVAGRLDKAGVSLLELNLSCPNVENHALAGYDASATAMILAQVKRAVACPVGVKLPPFVDELVLARMIWALRALRPAFITLTNTLGFALAIDADQGTTRLAARDGYGGLSGAALQPIALANVHTAASLLKGEIPIIGVGGVQSGRDAYAFLLAGASAVQVGTFRLTYRGHDALGQVALELAEHLRDYGLSETARDCVGKLRVAEQVMPQGIG